MDSGTSSAVGGVDPSPAKRKRQRVGGGDSNSSQRSSKSDHAAILRAAIEFRNQTGENITKAKMPAFYEFVKASLAESLSQEQIINRLRHIRHRFIHSDTDNTEDSVLKLARQLWSEDKDMEKGKEEKTELKSKERRQKNSIAADSNPHVEKGDSEKGVENAVEKSHNKERRQKNSIAIEGYQNAEEEVNGKLKMGVENTVEKNHKQKRSSKSITELVRNAEIESSKKNIKKAINNPQLDFDAVEEGNQEKRRMIQPKSKFSYLAHIVEDYWKTYGLSKTLLEIGIKNVDPQKAGFLEDKWEKQLQEEMKFQSEWRKTGGELLAMLLKVHKDSHVSGGH